MPRTKPRGRILAVDDSPDTLDALLQNLKAEGYDAVSAPGAAEALALLEREAFDTVITDMKMPGMSGMDLIKVVRERYPDVEIMMITGYATIEGAVEAVKTGAEEYLSKPFTLEELFAALERLSEKQRRLRKVRGVRGRFGMVGESDAMRRTFAAVEQAARHSGPVLILGERGTGRSFTARILAAERGLAQDPLIFLSPAALQSAWLPAMVQGEGRSGVAYLKAVDLASTQEMENVRALLAGHSLLPVHLFLSAGPDLPLMAERGMFPKDLYALLGANIIPLPPLRDRGEDAVLLAEHFAADFSQRVSHPPPVFSEAARRSLRTYSWPGNVEELKDAIARAFLRHSRGEISSADLPDHVRQAAETPKPRSLAKAEADHILHVLASTGGHRGRAAEILKIDRKTLREKLRSLEIEGQVP